MIQLASRVLKGAESNYFVTELELLAIVWTLAKFRSYLLGCQVIVETDHKALSFLLTCRFLSSRLTRWMLAIQDYDLQIKYIKGTENQIADALSRAEEPSGHDERALIAITLLRQPSKTIIKDLQEIADRQAQDSKLRRLIDKRTGGAILITG